MDNFKRKETDNFTLESFVVHPIDLPTFKVFISVANTNTVKMNQSLNNVNSGLLKL